jgi:putative transposase
MLCYTIMQNDKSASTMNTLQQGTTRWTHYQTGYHFVWIPKYRRRVFDAARQEAAKAAIAACCAQHEFALLAVETDSDHVHVFVSAAPRWAPATIVGLLKGYSSRLLRQQFPELTRICGREQLWTQAYYVGTAGAVSADVIARYIKDCQGR